MKIKEAIDKAKALEPSVESFQDSVLIGWLSNLDIQVFRENYENHEYNKILDDRLIESFNGYEPSVDRDTELLIDKAYAYDCYVHYIIAETFKMLAEYDKYNSFITMFNQAYKTYQNYYHRTHTPKGVKHISYF